MSNTQLDLGPYRGGSIRAVAVAFIIVSGIILILRFWSRALQRSTKFAADDWTALIAWPFISATNILLYEWSATAGLGHHAADLPPSFVVRGPKLLLAAEITYNIGMASCRISVSLLYWRIFSSSKYIRYAVWVTLALNAAWLITIEPIAIWQCNPPDALWGARKTGYTCLPLLSTQLFSGITSILLDFWLLILPLPVLWKLQIKPLKKTFLILVFILGYCVIFVTVGRLISIVRLGTTLNTDLPWAFVIMAYWYLCEMFVAQISISLPTLFHLAVRWMRHGFGSLFTDREYSRSLPQWSSSGDSARRTHSHDPDGFVRLPPETRTNWSGKGEDVELERFARFEVTKA